MSDEASDAPAEGEPVRRPVVRRSMMFTAKAVPAASGNAETPAEAGREVQSRGVAELSIGAGEALLDGGLDDGLGGGDASCPRGADSGSEADEPDLDREYEYEYLQSLASDAVEEAPGTATGPGRKKGGTSGSGGGAQDSGDDDSDQGDGGY